MVELAKIRIGPAGWAYPDWAGIVYPRHHPRGFHEAAYLARYFDAIEVNTSFYRPITPEMARRWLGVVQENPRFLFTLKLWQKFTHDRNATAEDEREFCAGLAPLQEAGRLGALLFQFPFSFHRDPKNEEYLKKLLARFANFPLVVEIRHASWNAPEFYALLHEMSAGFCNIDQPLIGRSLQPSGRATAPVGYVRLHGRRYDTWFSDDPEMPPEERYNYLYSEKELEPWVGRIRHVAQSSESTFVITNNHYEGKSVVNALQLIHLLTGRCVPAPPALFARYPQLEAIAQPDEDSPLLFKI